MHEKAADVSEADRSRIEHRVETPEQEAMYLRMLRVRRAGYFLCMLTISTLGLTISPAVAAPDPAVHTGPRAPKTAASVALFADLWHRTPRPDVASGHLVQSQIEVAAPANALWQDVPTIVRGKNGNAPLQPQVAPRLNRIARAPGMPIGETYYRYHYNGKSPLDPQGKFANFWIGTGGEFMNQAGGCKANKFGPAVPATTHPFPVVPAGKAYYEYDATVHFQSYKANNRGTERFVLEVATGELWYTPDHYCHFYPNPY